MPSTELSDVNRINNEIQNLRNYNSHKWNTKRQYVPGEPIEYICYCEDCGCENRGDPTEFPDLYYPDCNDMAD